VNQDTVATNSNSERRVHGGYPVTVRRDNNGKLHHFIQIGPDHDHFAQFFKSPSAFQTVRQYFREIFDEYPEQNFSKINNSSNHVSVHLIHNAQDSNAPPNSFECIRGGSLVRKCFSCHCPFIVERN